MHHRIYVSNHRPAGIYGWVIITDVYFAAWTTDSEKQQTTCDQPPAATQILHLLYVQFIFTLHALKVQLFIPSLISVCSSGNQKPTSLMLGREKTAHWHILKKKTTTTKVLWMNPHIQTADGDTRLAVWPADVEAEANRLHKACSCLFLIHSSSGNTWYWSQQSRP